MIHSQKPSANVVDGKLILSFPAAKTPVVWQMDLTKTHEAAFEVHEKKDTQDFALVLIPSDGNAKAVAHFTLNSAAMAALLVTAKALKDAHGQIAARTGATGTSSGLKPDSLHVKPRKGIKIFIILVLLAALIALWGYAQNAGLQQVVAERLPNAAPSAAQGPAAVGVPMSADDFLNRR